MGLSINFNLKLDQSTRSLSLTINLTINSLILFNYKKNQLH